MAIKYLNRRTLLRGVLAGSSVALGLPLLEIMLNQHGEALANGDPLPKRFMTFFWGNGVVLQDAGLKNVDRFTPATTGVDWQPSEELAPFSKVKDYVSVVTGFDNPVSNNKKITHHEGMVLFGGHDLEDIGFDPEFQFSSNYGGPTIDQVIANLPGVGDQTPVRSIQVGIANGVSPVDGGTTLHALSHAGYKMPLAPEHNPQKLWTNVFGSFVPPEDPSGPLRLSVLDAVRDQLGSLNKRLGSADKKRILSHLDGISELEKKLNTLPPLCETPMEPSITNEPMPGNAEELVVVSELMSDLLAYAFACDISRVGSFLFNEGAAEVVFQDIGQNSSYHQLSHAKKNPGLDDYHNGVVYIMERMAYMLEKFQATSDGADGNLLDHMAMLASSDCSMGWSHTVDRQPMIIAGKLGGHLTHPGVHIASDNGRNTSDVLLTLLQGFDETATEVGSGAQGSTTPLDELKATAG